MDIASSIGTVLLLDPEDSVGSEVQAISDIAWCPSEETVAGYTLEQTFALGETRESFTEERQDALKEKLVDALNAEVTGIVKLTPSSINLRGWRASIPWRFGSRS